MARDGMRFVEEDRERYSLRAEELAGHLEDAVARLMPAAIRVELGVVIEARLWPGGQDVVDRFLRDAKVDIVPVDADLAARAASGWRRYG